MIVIKRYDNTGLIDVTVERYGYHHAYKNVSVASFHRLLKLGKQQTVRMTTHAVTTIKL